VQEGDEVAAGQQRPQAPCQHLDARRRGVELGVEVVQQGRDDLGVVDPAAPDLSHPSRTGG
jgi:hypothetical protein